jgi:hypothetical protein
MSFGMHTMHSPMQSCVEMIGLGDDNVLIESLSEIMSKRLQQNGKQPFTPIA